MPLNVQLPKSFLILKPTILVGDTTVIEVCGYVGSEDDYIEWVKSKKMEHEFLIPDFFFLDYLASKGIVTTVAELIGEHVSLAGSSKIESATLLEKTGAGYSIFFLVPHTKKILTAFSLTYAEFIEAYSQHLKTL